MFEKLLKWLRNRLDQLFDDAVGSDVQVSLPMENALPLWVALYECGGPWCDEKRTFTACAWRRPSHRSSRVW